MKAAAFPAFGIKLTITGGPPPPSSITLKGGQILRIKDTNDFLRELRNLLARQQTLLRKLLWDTTRTWQSRPDWQKINLSRRADGYSFSVIAKPSPATDHWFWLDEGTDIRWAVMSNNWKSKTSPGIIPSGFSGNMRRERPAESDYRPSRYASYNVGGVRVRGRGLMTRLGIKPRPGIVRRGWTSLITDIIEEDTASKIKALYTASIEIIIAKKIEQIKKASEVSTDWRGRPTQYTGGTWTDAGTKGSKW